MNIETFTGAYFDYDSPSAADVNVFDVARSLSQTCRFRGHTSVFYSVAEHALLCRRLVVLAGRPDLAFAALHHDSHEAYLGDIPTPLKRMLGDSVAELADAIDMVIGEALGIDPQDFRHPVVKKADHDALRIEATVLKHSRGLGPHWGYSEPVPVPLWWKPGQSPDLVEHLFHAAHEIEVAQR